MHIVVLNQSLVETDNILLKIRVDSIVAGTFTVLNYLINCFLFFLLIKVVLALVLINYYSEELMHYYSDFVFPLDLIYTSFFFWLINLIM